MCSAACPPPCSLRSAAQNISFPAARFRRTRAHTPDQPLFGKMAISRRKDPDLPRIAAPAPKSFELPSLSCATLPMDPHVATTYGCRHFTPILLIGEFRAHEGTTYIVRRHAPSSKLSDLAFAPWGIQFWWVNFFFVGVQINGEVFRASHVAGSLRSGNIRVVFLVQLEGVALFQHFLKDGLVFGFRPIAKNQIYLLCQLAASSTQLSLASHGVPPND